jgi:hypothetical protein
MWAAARSRASAATRLEQLFLEIYAYHKDNLISEKRVHDIVLVAMENNWAAIDAHIQMMCNVIEMVVRDGIENGEFEPVEPRETAELIKRAMLHYCHPLMVAEALRERDEATVEKDARASVRFLIRAITPRR